MALNAIRNPVSLPSSFRWLLKPWNPIELPSSSPGPSNVADSIMLSLRCRVGHRYLLHALAIRLNANCCEVISSYATTPLLFEQRSYYLNNAPTKLIRGDYIAVHIYQFPLFLPEKNKHKVSD